MPAISFAATGTAPESTAWSWDADTQNAILGDDDNQNWARYKQAHAWWDGEDGAKSHFKLPHHRMGEDGKLEAVWRGVAAAMSRLSQSDLPEADMKPVFDHLASHYAQWDKEPPEWDRFWADVQERHARERSLTRQLPALVSSLRERETPMALAEPPAVAPTRLPGEAMTRSPILAAERPNGEPAEDDMDYINRQARRELSPGDVYVVVTESSNDGLDAYYTQMTPQTLANFAEDATSGVAFCDSHEHYRLPIGRTFYGRVDPVDRPDGSKATAAHLFTYMLRGLPLSNGMNSDDVIRGMDGGVYQDISVGFKPEKYLCSICGRDMLSDWQCMHWPGQTYEDEDGDEQVCIARVTARLAEHSLVYDGATPNAMTLKAEREMSLGRATARQLLFVEERCHVRLLDRFGGLALPPAAPSAAPPAGDGVAAPGWARSRPPAPQSAASRPAMDELDALEENDMRGSDLFARFMEQYEDLQTRAGKEISAGNLERLRDMQSQLTAGHDTMREGLEMMARFMDEKDAPDGDNPPPESDEGDSGKAAEAADDDEAGDDEPGASDKDDAHAPGKGRAAPPPTERKSGATPPPPESDDGDGDDDEPTKGDAMEEEDDDAARGARDDESGDETDESAGDDVPPEGDDADDESRDDDEAEENASDAEPGDDDAGAEGKSKAKDSGGKGKSTHGSGGGRAAGGTIDRLLAAGDLADDERELLEEARAYRRQLIEETLRAGVRALGAQFNPEIYRGLLERAGVSQIKAMRDNWQVVARTALSARGRWVEDPSEQGGGHYTSEPTGEGGRQSVARDPNDPVGVRGSTSPRGMEPGARQVRAAASDPSLYTVGGTSRKPARRS